jgi:hypothetical protein
MPETGFIAERSDGAPLNLHNARELAAYCSLNPIPRDRCWVMLYLLREAGLEPYLNEGKRSAERQVQLYREGKSKVQHSRHQDGDAWDICLYQHGWDAPKSFWQAVGHAARIAGCMWGGSWKTFPDPAHSQWDGGKILG